MKQFAERQLRKTKIDEAQKPLMQELEKIKREIDEFEDCRRAIAVGHYSTVYHLATDDLS